MANRGYKRLRSHSRLTGRFETGGIVNVQVNSPASPLGESGGYHYYNTTSNAELNWQVVNGNGYLTRHDTNVIGNPTRNIRGTGGEIEYIIGAGGGGGRHGGGGAGGIVGNGPLTPAPLRNIDLTAPQFAFITSNNTIKDISRNGSDYVGIVSTFSETVTIGAAGGSGTSGGNSTFFGRTATGGGAGGVYNGAGSPGGCGGGGNSGGSGSQGGNGGGAFNPRPGGYSAGGGGGTAGNASNPVAGGGITLSLPTPVSIGGGGASGGSNPGPSFCQGSQRPDGYCYGTFQPGAALPGCAPGPGGGGAASSNATSNSAGGGGFPNGGGTSSGSAGAAWFKISTSILKS